MVKINKKDNALIKRINLISEMKRNGIGRVNPEAILFLEEYIGKSVLNLLPAFKEEMVVHGRKTLKKEDIKSVLEKVKEKGEWEI